jgi:prepilin-type N-terminal cleavage/methylation domain-containing protein
MNLRRHKCYARAVARPGFTLIECMIAMFLIAIVLPAVGLSFAAITRSADLAHHRTEAAGLAQSELAALISNGNWQSAPTLKGDFGTDWPGYTWQAVASPWTGNANQTGSTAITMDQLDVTVNWGSAALPGNSVTVSSLVYQRPGTTGE